MMYRLSVLVVSLMLVNSAPALAQNPSCIFTMQQPFTFTASCVGQLFSNHNVVVGEVVRGVINVDMGEWQCLQMDVEVKKAQGWVLNFGNSPTNDGGGQDGTGDGDAGTFAHDSEFEIFVPGATPGPPGSPLPLPGFQTPGVLNIYNNELDLPPPPGFFMVNPFLPGTGKTSKLSFEVSQHNLCADSRISTVSLRMNGFIFNKDNTVIDIQAAPPGFNDTFYHIGFNQVVDLTVHPERVGTGVRKISIQVLKEDCGCAVIEP